MQFNIEKEQLSSVIKYMKKIISENKALYKELSDVYVGDLKRAKKLTEKLCTDIEKNYKSENTDIYKQSKSLDDYIYGTENMINSVLNDLSQWLKEQEAKLKYLEEQEARM